MFCIPLYIFIELQIWLYNNNEMKPLKHIGIPKILIIFVDKVGWGTINRDV